MEFDSSSMMATKRRCSLKQQFTKSKGPGLVHEIPGLLSKSECDELIAFSERCGFRRQRFGTAVPAEIRYRVAIDDPSMALELWELLRPQLRELREYFDDQLRSQSEVNILNFEPFGLNERLRFYKYHEGERFARHPDISFEKTENERSFLSFIVYLNEDFRGGETKFEGRLIQPKVGSAIVFPHDLLHEGMIVSRGVKRVLRTDVMGLLKENED